MGEVLFTTAEALEAARRAADRRYLEFLRVPDLSAGLYVLDAGAADPQSPHGEDEIYVVQAGAATVVTDSGTAEVGPGSVIFVPAGEQHRFTGVRGDLSLLVVFAPPYGSRPAVENPAPAPTSP